MAAQEKNLTRRLFEGAPGGGRIITLSDIANHNFPEGKYPPKEQMIPILRLFNQMLHVNQAPLYLSAETYLPILAEQHPNTELPAMVEQCDNAGFNSPEYRLRRQLAVPKIAMYVKTPLELDRVAMGLTSTLDGNKYPFEYVSKFDLGYSVDDRIAVARMNTTKVKIAGTDPDKVQEKTPYFIFEEKATILGFRYLTLSLAVDIDDESRPARHFSTLQPLLTFDVKLNSVEGSYLYTDTPPSSRDMIINWDALGMAEWVDDTQEPFTVLTDANFALLNESKIISSDALTQLEKTCAGVYAPERQITSAQEREARPYYYLELLMAAAKMTYYASHLQDKNHPFFTSNHSQATLRDEFGSRLLHLFQTEIGTRHQSKATKYYSPLEYLMYELLWRGENIWEDQQEFTAYMTKAAERHPAVFWHTLGLLGLDNILPAFREMNVNDKALLRSYLHRRKDEGVMTGVENFCKAYEKTRHSIERRPGESTLSYWTRLMSFLPDLSKYYDPGKELQQSDNYYMKICLALAYFALEKGIEQVAALAVHKGRIIAADHNQSTQYPDIFVHAEASIVSKARHHCNPSDKITVFVSAECCPGCADALRKIPPRVSRVVCGTRTTTGGESVFHILSSHDLNAKVGPYGEPPEVVFDVLGEEARQLFNMKSGWADMIQ